MKMMKMRNVFLIGLLWMFPFIVEAQCEKAGLLLVEGADYHDKGMYDDAIRVYESALKMCPSSMAARYELALTLFEKGDYARSLVYSRQVVRSASEIRPEAIVLHGSALEKRGELKKAMKYYRQAVEDYPQHPALRFSLANGYFKLQDYPKAAYHVQKAIELEPLNAEYQLLMANVLVARGERFKTLLPIYYYLLINQDSPQSLEAYNMLELMWSELEKTTNSSEHSQGQSGYNKYQLAEMELVKLLKKNSEPITTKLKKNVFLTGLFLDVVKSQKWDQNDFWYNTYLNLFTELHGKGHAEAFGYFISNCKYKPEVLLWVNDYPQRLSKFADWMMDK
jgi:tetratricopeptide (TPR) repeat protein